jgi:hypothetical protein
MAQTKTQKKRSTTKTAKPKAAKKAPAQTNGSGNGLISNAKLPLVAGGAAVAGAAGGLALASTKQAKKSRLGSALMRKPRIKVNSGDVAKAAKEVGNFSAQVGELANELQRARESADGKRRSPIEVVLQGLTARR